MLTRAVTGARRSPDLALAHLTENSLNEYTLMTLIIIILICYMYMFYYNVIHVALLMAFLQVDSEHICHSLNTTIFTKGNKFCSLFPWIMKLLMKGKSLCLKGRIFSSPGPK